LGEHGRGRGHGFPKNILEGMGKSRMWILVCCEVSLLPSGEICPVGNSIESIREQTVARAIMVNV
jgi:hypothetical protein